MALPNAASCDTCGFFDTYYPGVLEELANLPAIRSRGMAECRCVPKYDYRDYPHKVLGVKADAPKAEKEAALIVLLKEYEIDPEQYAEIIEATLAAGRKLGLIAMEQII